MSAFLKTARTPQTKPKKFEITKKLTYGFRA